MSNHRPGPVVPGIRRGLDEGRRLLTDTPDRFDGVMNIGVDEHVWRHTRHGDKYP